MTESRLSKFVQIFVFPNAWSRRQCRGSKNKYPRSIGIKIFTRPFPITLDVRILIPICTNNTCNHPFVTPPSQLYPLEETKRDVINKDAGADIRIVGKAVDREEEGCEWNDSE